jgi:hypothetical protein
LGIEVPSYFSIQSLSDGSFVLGGVESPSACIFGLRKYNSSYELDWTSLVVNGIEGHFNSVIVSNYPEPESGFYAIGYTYRYSGFLAKFNAQGDTLWTRMIDYPGSYTRGHAVVELPNGEVVTGCSNFYTDNDPDLQRWSPDGDLIEESDTDVAQYGVSSIILDPDGETIYTLGEGWVGETCISAFSDFHTVEWSELHYIEFASGDRSFIRLPNGQFLIFGGRGFLIAAKTNAVGVEADEETAPLVGFAMQAYPNPFNPETTIKYDLAEKGNVTLEVCNIKGQRVRTLVRETVDAGFHSVAWNGRDETGKTVSSGVYFYRLSTTDKTLTKKMLLLK